MSDVQTLAKVFSAVLKEWLTDEQFQEMKDWNGRNRDNPCCASHDYCDANMAMVEALIQHGTMKSHGDDPLIHKELMNAAWTHARQEGLI